MSRAVFFRIIFVVLTLAFVGTFFVGTPVRYRELTELCPADACEEFLLLTPQEANLLAEVGIPTGWYAVFQIGLEAIIICMMTGIALVIFWQRSDDWMALIVALALMTYGASMLTEADGALVRANPSLAWIISVQSFLSLGLLLMMLYLFPSGRFAPPFMKYVLIIFLPVVTFAAVRATDTLAFITWSDPLVEGIYLGWMLLGVISQAYRYRFTSTPVERQQTKWIVVGLAVAVIAMFMWSLLWNFSTPGRFQLLASTVGMLVLLTMLLMVPVTLAFSILRYRLWDIDLIIRRTLIYSAITALLAGVYFGSVVVMQSVFRALTGGQSSLAVVISTLGIAALFSPLRGRVQTFIDRRFYRQKYDAQKALERFSETVRDEVDMDQIRVELLRVVAQTMQPADARLWLVAERAAAPEERS